MTKTALQKDIEARVALDRKIAAAHLTGVQSVVDLLDAAKVEALAEKLENKMSEMDDTSQTYTKNIIDVLRGAPMLLRRQVEDLTSASAEPLADPSADQTAE